MDLQPSKAYRCIDKYMSDRMAGRAYRQYGGTHIKGRSFGN
jgi:hypothetical protein